jgi:2-oxo-4-hydroxy-4-carboxy--5-ureidoimidazoline (OHCU) decarboxylase
LGCLWKHSPWSIAHSWPSGPSSTWPLLRSALLATMSKAHMARSVSPCSPSS